MSPLFDFSDEDLAIIHGALRHVLALSRLDDNAPQGIQSAIENCLAKLDSVIELRVEINEQFDSIVEQSLHDVRQYSHRIINETEK